MPVDEEAVKAKLKEAFDSVDEDGDGVISADDLKTVLENAGFQPTDDQVEVYIILFSTQQILPRAKNVTKLHH